MKYSKERIEALKNRILINTDLHSSDLVAYSVENLSLSKNTVLKYINELILENKLLRNNSGRYTTYSLPTEVKKFSFKRSAKLSEETMISRVLEFTGKLSTSAMQIFDYAFMEIANNAIEHSEAKEICVIAEKSMAKLKISIQDNGIGIFAKIKEDLNLDNETQAVIELSKGKFTSSPQKHSGEGIFFSSKLCDNFFIFSHGLVYSPQAENPTIGKDKNASKGTKVVFEILRDTKKIPQEIFKEYAGSDYDSPKFKTVVQLRFMQQEGLLLTSRSQARRLLTRMEKFTTVVLDFFQVDFIGQAFADEIFRVYATKHPGIRFESINANEQIEQMIRHVKSMS
ncbi:MAG: DUF4325 domain-containing protein [Treponema sp.]|nr:DUF4325 domain-containing protein [Treponema sp.]